MYEDFKKRFNIPSAINAGVYINLMKGIFAFCFNKMGKK
jgi:hypothetical protein